MNSFELKKGVLEHAFFDGSGTILFKVNTGETIGLSVSLNELFLDSADDESKSMIQTLIHQGFLQSQ